MAMVIAVKSNIFMIITAYLSMYETLSTELEPSCSKFHFEEKVLEKLVRLEHSTDILKGDIISTVEGIKKEVEKIKSELKEMRMKTEDRTSKNGSSFAFAAKVLTNESPKINERLVFRDVLLNEAGVYDPTTGKFTAQIGGTYAFTYSLCIDSGKYMSFRIIVDGREISRDYKHERNALTMVSAYAVVPLTAGSEVWIESDYGSSSGSMYQNADGSICWNRFSGHILN